MYHLGYYEHYLSLKRKYPGFRFDYPRDWSLKEYGALWIFDIIQSTQAKRVLEIGCGYDTFFARETQKIGVDYWYIDKSNDYLGINKNDRTYAVPLYMGHKFVFFKILPLQLVPLRKS